MVQKQMTTEVGLLLVGLAFTILGAVMTQVWDALLQTNFEKGLILAPDSPSFPKWQKTPIPVMMGIYFWNWTNPEDIHQEGYKPNFVEMGPYVFREVQEKVNLTWNENGTITFRIVKQWYLEESLTNGSVEDEVTSINMVSASASYMSKDASRFVLYPLSMYLAGAGQRLTWTRRVRELLFEGFDNPVQKIASYMPGLGNREKFGWFYNTNNTLQEDVFNMETGANNISDIGLLRLWNFLNTTEKAEGACSFIEGNHGEFWPPYRTKDEPLRMYRSEMCRQVSYYYERESEYRGLPTFVFAGTEETVDNGTRLSENLCHCGKEGCLPSGVMDVSNCSMGAPVFLSYPHFYNADAAYRDNITGMNPDAEKHKFFIELEPTTGSQLNVAGRMQVNVLLHKNPVLSSFRNVPNLFIPVFWVEHKAALTEEYVSGIRLLLFLKNFGLPAWYAVCAMGAMLILAVAIFHFYYHPPFKFIEKNVLPQPPIKTDNLDDFRLQQLKDNSRETVKYRLPKSETVEIIDNMGI